MKIKNTSLEVDNIFELNSIKNTVSLVIDIEKSPKVLEKFEEYCELNNIDIYPIDEIDDIIRENLVEDSEKFITNDDLISMIRSRLY